MKDKGFPHFGLVELFEIADRAFKAGNYEEAIEAYELVFMLPRLTDRAIELTCWGIGECYLNLRQYEQAEHSLKEAIKKNKNEPNYHYLLGVTYSNQARSSLAIKSLNKALELKPDDPEILRCVGWATYFSGRKAEGIAMLKKSLKLNPSSPHTLCDLGVAYMNEGKMGEAMTCVEEAKRIDPEDAFVKKVVSDLGKFEKAFKELKNKESQTFKNGMPGGGKRMCDLCGKIKKLGGFVNPSDKKPKIVCVDCMIELSAKEQKITIKEAKHRRSRMFASNNLFVKLKVEEYFKLKGRKFLSVEEGNRVLDKITEVWNNKFTIEQRKSFEQMTDEELKKTFSNVSIDFSGTEHADSIKTAEPKIRRNDPCPCGSGKKYKKCCGIN